MQTLHFGIYNRYVRCMKTQVIKFIRLWALFPVTLLLIQCNPSGETADALGPDEITTIFLVRHAEKADDGTDDPDLDSMGAVRAEVLAKMLLPSEIRAIYSTDYKRTRQTGQPLADMTGLDIDIYIPHDTAFIHDMVNRHRGEAVLVVGHSNTIPALVNQLVGEKAHQQLEEMEYDKLFIVTVFGEIASDMVVSY
jgi:2,3-bisphosphoglycerate-dependent phosphoglycerate mutase